MKGCATEEAQGMSYDVSARHLQRDKHILLSAWRQTLHQARSLPRPPMTQNVSAQQEQEVFYTNFMNNEV